MTDKKDIIQTLLTEDYRKYLAEKLLTVGINEMVIIYREGNTFQYLATEQAPAITFGMIDMAHSLIMDIWLTLHRMKMVTNLRPIGPEDSFKVVTRRKLCLRNSKIIRYRKKQSF
jgi:hypothetical protein